MKSKSQIITIAVAIIIILGSASLALACTQSGSSTRTWSAASFIHRIGLEGHSTSSPRSYFKKYRHGYTATTTATTTERSADEKSTTTIIKTRVSKPVASKSTTEPVSATVTATDFVTQLEQEVHRLVNVERAAQGLSSLTYDSQLAAIARAHSADMAANSYFSHTNLSECDAACRYKNAGYAYRSLGENIFMSENYRKEVPSLARLVVDGWMNSPGHRTNILRTSFTHEGIGVAVIGGKVYTTENFSTPR